MARPRLRLLLPLVLGFAIALPALAEPRFASREDGRRMPMARDDFVARMSPFDRAARMATDREVGEEAFLAFAGDAVLECEDEEKRRLASALAAIERAIARLLPGFGGPIHLVKTSGEEEGGQPYTRGRGADLPPELRARKITNPDAPHAEYCLAFRLMLVDGTDSQEARLVGLEEVAGFHERVGRNTKYVIHPEETLADHFALLVEGASSLPSPEVLAKVAEALREAAGARESD